VFVVKPAWCCPLEALRKAQEPVRCVDWRVNVLPGWTIPGPRGRSAARVTAHAVSGVRESPRGGGASGLHAAPDRADSVLREDVARRLDAKVACCSYGTIPVFRRTCVLVADLIHDVALGMLAWRRRRRCATRVVMGFRPLPPRPAEPHNPFPAGSTFRAGSSVCPAQDRVKRGTTHADQPGDLALGDARGDRLLREARCLGVGLSELVACGRSLPPCPGEFALERLAIHATDCKGVDKGADERVQSHHIIKCPRAAQTAGGVTQEAYTS
jgi:hypothetical protein